jgi:AcrR family transcriptional regulator
MTAATSLPVTGSATTLEDRILDAVLACVTRSGLRATTVDAIAREAGCGRATVYRTFPGGRDQLFEGASLRQLHRFAASVEGQLAAIDDLEDLLVAGIAGASRFLDEHGALRHLLDHEPEAVLSQFAFDRFDAVLATVRSFAVPHLARFVPERRAVEVAELLTRLVISYLFVPRDDVDLSSDADARRLVRTFVLPVVQPDLIDLT